MENAVLPFMSTQLYDLGNNEMQIPNWDMSMQVNDKFVESKVFENDNLLRAEGYSFPIPIQSSLDSYQSGFASHNLTWDSNIFLHQSNLLGADRKFLAPYCEDFHPELNVRRKRPIEFNDNDILPKNRPSHEVMADNNKDLGDWWTSERNKGTKYDEQQCHNHVEEASTNFQEHRFQVPIRRGQKFSDKITSLQKLVSPYGKTDTASVLREASIYIKLLQVQIQSLYGMLSSSYDSARAIHSYSQEIERKELDLGSKGLCLVPISFTHKVTMEGQVVPSRQINIERHF